jgi:hypothetical protein
VSDQPQESRESRAISAGYVRHINGWVDGDRLLTLEEAIAEIEAGKAPGLPTVDFPPTYSDAMTEEQIDQVLNGPRRAQQEQADRWANHLADLVVAKLKPMIRAELRKAKTEADRHGET